MIAYTAYAPVDLCPAYDAELNVRPKQRKFTRVPVNGVSTASDKYISHGIDSSHYLIQLINEGCR